MRRNISGLVFGNVKDTLIAANTIPYAFIGGFISFWVTGAIFGISADVGFIILFGVTSINSILLIALMKERMLRTNNLRLAIDEAVSDCLRPILMVALMGSMGSMGFAARRPLNRNGLGNTKTFGNYDSRRNSYLYDIVFYGAAAGVLFCV